MHILFLSDNFLPEVNAPASRTYEQCREWVRAGHRVTVMTCCPNFPRGRVYEGYRNGWRCVEEMELFKKTLVRRGIDGGKIDVVTNGVDISRFQPMEKDRELAEQLEEEQQGREGP